MNIKITGKPAVSAKNVVVLFVVFVDVVVVIVVVVVFIVRNFPTLETMNFVVGI